MKTIKHISKLKELFRTTKPKAKDYNDFNLLMDLNYKRKNEMYLKNHMNYLAALKVNNKYIIDIEQIKRYVRFKNINDGFEKNNINFLDDDNSFLNNMDRLKSIKQFSRVKYLEHKNNHKKSVFITFTNPSKYHYYKQNHNEDLIRNKNCKDELLETIKKSIENINDINRYFYKCFKQELTRNKRINKSFDFVRVLENHKNLSIHSHSIIYINEEDIKLINKAYLLTIKKFSLKKTDLQILNRAKSSSYIIKYIIKNIRDKENDISLYQKYKRFFSNKRFFTTSNFKTINQDIMNKIYNHLRINHKGLFLRMRKSKTPLYIHIENYYKRYCSRELKQEIRSNLNYDKIKSYIKEKSINNLYELEQTGILELKAFYKQIKRKKLTKLFDNKNNKIIYAANKIKIGFDITGRLENNV